jgi:hypothetical protein
MINRTNQDARLKTTPAVSSPIMGPDKDRDPTGSLRTALATNQAINGIDSRANTHPAGFARHDRSTRPRVNQAKAVVMPHVGQSRPVMMTNEQGWSPSWR